MLGSALCRLLPDAVPYPYRLEESNVPNPIGYELAFLCAGTKGFANCEGNRQAFLADVDGNIRLARALLRCGTFVVFVSTDAVEVASGAAYARNRLLVEFAIGGLPRVGIFRPAKFDQTNVEEVARACAEVGLERIEGLTRWP